MPRFVDVVVYDRFLAGAKPLHTLLPFALAMQKRYSLSDLSWKRLAAAFLHVVCTFLDSKAGRQLPNRSSASLLAALRLQPLQINTSLCRTRSRSRHGHTLGP